MATQAVSALYHTSLKFTASSFWNKPNNWLNLLV